MCCRPAHVLGMQQCVRCCVCHVMPETFARLRIKPRHTVTTKPTVKCKARFTACSSLATAPAYSATAKAVQVLVCRFLSGAENCRPAAPACPTEGRAGHPGALNICLGHAIPDSLLSSPSLALASSAALLPPPTPLSLRDLGSNVLPNATPSCAPVSSPVDTGYRHDREVMARIRGSSGCAA